MEDSKVVPGQMDQPPKDIRDTGYQNAWEMTDNPTCTVPNTYATPNDCQIKAWHNMTQTITTQTANDLNGGKDMTNGGGVG